MVLVWGYSNWIYAYQAKVGTAKELVSQHMVSSAYNRQSNHRAEWAVKAAKRMVRDSTGHNGILEINMFLPALLLSSSEVIFGRNIKDLLPFAPRKLQVRAEWHELMEHHELVKAKRHLAKS